MAKTKSWEVSDAFWERVEPLIPPPRRDPTKSYKRKPGGGRRPMPPRQIFAAIVYVLRTGCQWQSLPKERFGSPSAIHTHFLKWLKAGFFALVMGGVLANAVYDACGARLRELPMTPERVKQALAAG